MPDMGVKTQYFLYYLAPIGVGQASVLEDWDFRRKGIHAMKRLLFPKRVHDKIPPGALHGFFI
jgi:hypothetical protein